MKTLAFDVYGTLINTSSLGEHLRPYLGKKTKAFMNLWRNKQLEYSFRRSLMEQYAPFSTCTKDGLLFTCKAFGVKFDDKKIQEILKSYKYLKAFKDVKVGLRELQNSSYRLYAFSNGLKKDVKTLLKANDLLDFFDDIVSVDDIKVFKPSPKAYEYFCKYTNSKPKDSYLISSNSFDILGATNYKMGALWCQRDKENIMDSWLKTDILTVNKISKIKKLLKEI